MGCQCSPNVWNTLLAWQCSNFKIQGRNNFFSQTIFSEFILKLGQGLCSSAHDETWNTTDWQIFFSSCHNKAGGVRGDTSGVSDPAWLTEQGYSALLWLAALICERGKQELPVPSGRACKQNGWVGGGARQLICVYTHTNIHTVAVKLRVWICCTKCSHAIIFRQQCFQFDWLQEEEKNTITISNSKAGIWF